MTTTPDCRLAHAATRLICALLAIGGLAAIAASVVVRWRTGSMPGADDLIVGLCALAGVDVLGRYALNPRGDVGVEALPEPSARVRDLALWPRAKIEAIKAYREETGLGVAQAKTIVDRIAAEGRAAA